METIKFKYYYVIVLVIALMGCEKENNTDLGTEKFSLEIAKSYFENYVMSSRLSKSGDAIYDVTNTMFHVGNFELEWDRAEYDDNSIFRGYYVNILRPEYEYMVERAYYEKGEFKTFDAPVNQRLVIIYEHGTGRISPYILSLIPDRHCGEAISNDVKGLSKWEGYSGIAIYSNLQTGVPVSISRFINGRQLSSVYMMSITYEGVTENVKKFFNIMGPMVIKSKVKQMTKGEGSSGDGSEPNDGNYNETPCWELGKFYYIGGGYYWDGTDVWKDYDGDGFPDNISLDTVLVVDNNKKGDEFGDDYMIPPADPFSGDIGGYNGEDGGSGGGYGSLEISDEEKQAVAYSAVSKMEVDFRNGDYVSYSATLNTLNEPEITLIGAVSNVEGLWTSWLPAIKNSPTVLKYFGSALTMAGIFDSGPDAIRTLVAIIQGNTEDYTTQEVLEMVSTGLNTIGFIACCVPEPITTVVGSTLSFTGCVVGLIAPMFNCNEVNMGIGIHMQLTKDLSVTLYLA